MKTNMPKLRFPEFQDAPAWKEKIIEDIFEFHRTASCPRADLSDSGDTFYIHYGDIHKKFHTYVDFEKDNIPKISRALCKNAALLKNGDLIIADASEDTEGIAKAVEVCGLDNGVKAVAGLHTLLLRDSNGAFENGFKGLIGEIKSVRTQIQRIAVGVKVYSVSQGALKQIRLPLPPFPEQQKIADCLASLDGLISTESRKLDALASYKKGLMQQLFPAEGETVPKLRFPEFRNTSAWEEKRLEDFVTIVRGGSPRPIEEYITNEANGLNWLKIGDIDRKSKFVTRTQEKVTPAALTKTRVVTPGDLILSNSMSFGRPYIMKIKACIHDGWIAVSKIDNRIDRDFLYYTMMTPSSQAYFSNNAAGSGVQNLNADIIKLLPFLCPNKKEQQKIANCLTSLDELIAVQTEKLDGLKNFKKGMMQQLFPAVDEVSV